MDSSYTAINMPWCVEVHHLEVVVLSEVWPCPEVSVHICYIYTPGHHWPPSPSNETDQMSNAVEVMRGAM